MKFFLSALITALALAWLMTEVRSAPACQSYKSPVQCEVGGKCIWTVSKGKKSKCLPLAVSPRR